MGAHFFNVIFLHIHKLRYSPSGHHHLPGYPAISPRIPLISRLARQMELQASQAEGGGGGGIRQESNIIFVDWAPLGTSSY